MKVVTSNIPLVAVGKDKMIKGEVYTRPDGRVFFRSDFGVVDLETGEAVSLPDIRPETVFIHHPGAHLVLP